MILLALCFAERLYTRIISDLLSRTARVLFYYISRWFATISIFLYTFYTRKVNGKKNARDWWSGSWTRYHLARTTERVIIIAISRVRHFKNLLIFFALTWNQAECYGTRIHVTMISSMKFESAPFGFFKTCLNELQFSSFSDYILLFCISLLNYDDNPPPSGPRSFFYFNLLYSNWNYLPTREWSCNVLKNVKHFWFFSSGIILTFLITS